MYKLNKYDLLLFIIPIVMGKSATVNYIYELNGIPIFLGSFLAILFILSMLFLDKSL